MSGCGCNKKVFDDRGYQPFVRSTGNVEDGLVCVFADESGRVIKGDMPLSELVDMVAEQVLAEAVERVMERFMWLAGRVKVRGSDVDGAPALYARVEAELMSNGLLSLGLPDDAAPLPGFD